MTQKELSEILHDIGCPVNEGVSSLKNEKVFPRIDYWQISFYAKKPRNPKLIELKKRLNELGYHPAIAHEFVTEDKVWHSYFSITTDGAIE